MKIRALIFWVFILFPAFSFAQEDSIHFRDVSLDEGLKMAQVEKKPVFFFAFASWCEHCHRMREKIFKSPSVAGYYNTHFVCLKQDMEKGQGIDLYNQFQVKSYPTFVFLDSSGTTLYQFSGEKDTSAMVEQGGVALTPARQFPYLKKQFEEDVSNSEKCFMYVFALRAAALDCTEPAMKHLATQNEKQLLTEINWKIIANGIRDINSWEFKFVLAHQKEYAAITSQGRVERKIVNVVEELLSPFVTAGDSAGYFSKRPSVEAIHYHKADSVLFKFDIQMYERMNNWDAYKKVTTQSAETLAWNNLSQLKDIINDYLWHITDSAALENAAKWAKHAIELSDEYSTYIVCAKLYRKAGDKKAAIEMAQKGKAEAVKFGWEHKDADILLTELQK